MCERDASTAPVIKGVIHANYSWAWGWRSTIDAQTQAQQMEKYINKSDNIICEEDIEMFMTSPPNLLLRQDATACRAWHLLPTCNVS